MKERWMRFMSGRYGADELSKVLLGICFVCLILNLITGVFVFYPAAFVFLGLCYARSLSRNYTKRYQENQAYLRMKEKWIYRIGMSRQQREQRKKFQIFRCPSCQQKIRIPRGKGKICITCPKCKTQFERRRRRWF